CVGEKRASESWPEVTIVASNPPVEQNIFHLWATPDVVNNQVAARLRRFAIYYDTDMRHVPAKIPGNKISRGVVLRARADKKRFSFTSEEGHQIRDAAMIDIRVGVCQKPAPLIRVCGKIVQHVLVNLFLQIDPDGAVGTNDFVGAHAGICRHVAVWIWNSDVGRVIPNGMVRALYGGVDQLLKKSALYLGNCRRSLCR